MRCSERSPDTNSINSCLCFRPPSAAEGTERVTQSGEMVIDHQMSSCAERTSERRIMVGEHDSQGVLRASQVFPAVEDQHRFGAILVNDHCLKFLIESLRKTWSETSERVS
jgi:hypothetical protein